jgi:Tol biopolymer transport system component
LRAVRFDLERLEVIGTSIPLVSQIATLPTGTAEFDIAGDGTLVYVAGAAGDASNRTLVWVDRQGREEPLKAAPARAYLTPRLSPDGTRVAVEIREQGNDIWVWNIVRETLTRVTSDPGVDQAPVWAPDGRRLVFSSQAGGAAGALFWQLADGAGSAERLTQSSNAQIPSAVLADGSRVLFWETSTESATDLKTVTLDGDRAVQPLLLTPQPEVSPTVSPDGRWLAYQSTDSDQTQIFVRPFPKVDEAKIQVSTGGGIGPVWAKTGEQLFFQALDGALMSVDVRGGGSWTAGAPTRLIEARYYVGTRLAGTANYDVASDGKRFLMLKESGNDSNLSPTIVVVQNWTEEVKRLVPGAR